MLKKHLKETNKLIFTKAP